jgi:hypothetical protein
VLWSVWEKWEVEVMLITLEDIVAVRGSGLEGGGEVVLSEE